MLILLVRHGQAGSKRSWVGGDRSRPLDDRGHAEARGIREELVAHAPSRIISTPYLRCLQTVEPLAKRLDLSIEQSHRLVPGSGQRAEGLLRELAEASARAVVVCTHGEIIADLQVQLERRGQLFGPRRSRAKGSVWVLERTGRKFTSATYLPPRPA